MRRMITVTMNMITGMARTTTTKGKVNRKPGAKKTK
jgi:hypothetical protein